MCLLYNLMSSLLSPSSSIFFLQFCNEIFKKSFYRAFLFSVAKKRIGKFVQKPKRHILYVSKKLAIVTGLQEANPKSEIFSHI